MLVGIANREDPDQTASFGSALFVWQLVLEILEHLPVVRKHKPVHFHVRSNTFTAIKVVCFVICCCIL